MELKDLRNQVAAVHYLRSVDKKKNKDHSLDYLAYDAMIVASTFVQTIEKFDNDMAALDTSDAGWKPYQDKHCPDADCSEVCQACSYGHGEQTAQANQADRDQDQDPILEMLRKMFPGAEIKVIDSEKL